jgi:hypothetical protein
VDNGDLVLVGGVGRICGRQQSSARSVRRSRQGERGRKEGRRKGELEMAGQLFGVKRALGGVRGEAGALRQEADAAWLRSSAMQHSARPAMAKSADSDFQPLQTSDI